jgi:hypothetical protein
MDGAAALRVVVVTSGGARGENIGTRFESNRRNFALTVCPYADFAINIFF